MFECIINKLKDIDGGRHDFIFNTLCWANNTEGVPATKLAEAIIKALPEMKGSPITPQEVITTFNSSKKGYNRNFSCIDTFHCTNPDTCPYLTEKPIEIELFQTGYLISFLPNKDIELKFYKKMDDSYSFESTLNFNLHKFKQAGKKSDMADKLDSLGFVEKDHFVLFQSAILKKIDEYETQKELEEMLQRTSKEMKEADTDQQHYAEITQYLEGKDKIGLARSYFMLSLGGTPYRALLMWLSHLLTISNINYSPYIIVNGSSGAGKSEETERSLKAIADEYVINISGVTRAAVKIRGRQNSYYYDRKIINLGDKGGKYDNEEMAVIVPVFKTLWSEGYAFFEQADKENPDTIIRTELFGHPSLTYTTVDFSSDIDEQETGRGFNFNIIKNKDIIRMHNECIDTHRYAYDKWSLETKKILPEMEKALKIISKDIYNADLGKILVPKIGLDWLKDQIPTSGGNQERLYILVIELGRVIAWLRGESEVTMDIMKDTFGLVATTTVNTMELSDSAKLMVQFLINVDSLTSLQDIENLEGFDNIKKRLAINTARYELQGQNCYDNELDNLAEDILVNMENHTLVWNRKSLELLEVLATQGQRLTLILNELVDAGFLELIRFDRDSSNYYRLKTKDFDSTIEKPKLHTDEYFPYDKKPKYSTGRKSISTPHQNGGFNANTILNRGLKNE